MNVSIASHFTNYPSEDQFICHAIISKTRCHGSRERRYTIFILPFICVEAIVLVKTWSRYNRSDFVLTLSNSVSFHTTRKFKTMVWKCISFISWTKQTSQSSFVKCGFICVCVSLFLTQSTSAAFSKSMKVVLKLICLT